MNINLTYGNTISTLEYDYGFTSETEELGVDETVFETYLDGC
jgi:hypothetical protein